MSRTLAWFSSGAASAVMSKLELMTNPSTIVVQCDMGESEDFDNKRFSMDCEEWFGVPIKYIKSSKYNNIDEVFEARKYLAGANGAPCTSEMKVAPRLDFELPSDTHLFGYTADSRDVKRWEAMLHNYPHRKQRAPLIERGLTKEACLSIIERAGILPPRVYGMGFPNANCIGCVKASSPAYWALVRDKFPDVFKRRAEQDDRFGRNRLQMGGVRMPLSELPVGYPTKGAVAPRCDFLCQIAEMDIEND